MMTVIKLFLIISAAFFIFVEKAKADVCTPVKKPTKYFVKKADHIASILRLLDLEPVFGSGGSLQKLLKVNNLQNPNLIEPGNEIVIPFACEEKATAWTLIDRGEDRLITLEKVKISGTNSTDENSTPAVNEVPPKPSETVENKTIEILNKDQPTEPQVSTEGAPSDDKVSEALRYRMICDGEWTGNECITRYSVFYIAGVGTYFRYDGIDATTGDTGILLSKLAPGINLGWANYWFENFKTELGFALQNLAINDEARGRPILQNKQVLTNFYGLAKFEFGRFGFSAGLAQQDAVFYRFNKENIVIFQDGGVEVQVVPIMQYRGAVSYLLNQKGKYRFDGEIGVYTNTAGQTSGYTVQPGAGWDLSLKIQHDLIQEYLFGSIKFGRSQQDTSIEKQLQTDLSLQFGYAWKLKDW